MQDKAKNAGKVAIVLEGGSFRGEFTAGVLDVLMENGVEVAACYGTSAGALNGLNYKSRQIGRVNRVNLAFCNDPRYMGAQSLVTTGSMVGYDFILNDVQDRLDPFDNEAFFANPMEMYACATDIVFRYCGVPARSGCDLGHRCRACFDLASLGDQACRDRWTSLPRRWYCGFGPS